MVSEPLVLEETLDALTESQTQGIVITLLGAFVLLVGYFGLVDRKPVLGAITMVPSIAVVGWVLGTMVLLDISFNVLTAMVASLAIGIGVPFGIHVTHRFMEDRRCYDSIDEAIRQTVTHTGGAMAGSAATTAAGFGVLAFASLVPMQQFGIIVAVTIVCSLLAARCSLLAARCSLHCSSSRHASSSGVSGEPTAVIRRYPTTTKSAGSSSQWGDGQASGAVAQTPR